MLGMHRRELALIFIIAAVTAVAGGLTYGPGASTLSFAVSTAALAGVAWMVSFATEQLGETLGPEATGLMQSTLGNLPEFFVVLFALAAGETVVAMTSIIGSIFANALLVLGIVLVVGARASDDGIMRFSKRLPTDTATLMLLATFIIVAIGLSVGSNDKASAHVKGISIVGAVCLLVVYAFWVWSYVRGGGDAESSGHVGGNPRLSPWVSGGLLAVAGVGAAFVSDWFVKGLDPAITSLHVSKAFAGIVIVAIAGNAIENATGVVLAHKGQSELALSVVKNSVSQIAVFLFPALILASLFFSEPLTFQMAPIWVGSLALTGLVVWQVTGDGKAAAWEGIALIAFYVILATVAIYE